MKIINVDYLISIEVRDKRPVWYFMYRPFKKGSLLRSEIKEGFYNLDHKYYSKDDLEKDGYLIENNRVYKKPCLTYTFENGEETVEYETYQEAVRATEVETYITRKLVIK